MSTESQRQRPTGKDQQLEHDSILAAAGGRINSGGFWRGSPPAPHFIHFARSMTLLPAAEWTAAGTPPACPSVGR